MTGIKYDKKGVTNFRKCLNCLDNGKPVSKETFNEIIDVINGFIHKCHQEKEDKLLFPFLKNVRGGEKKDF